MAYNRTINVRGTEVIETKTVTITFDYVLGTPPLKVSFNITGEGFPTVYGSCTKEGIENYNVSGGIVTDEFLELVKVKCVAALTNYETV